MRKTIIGLISAGALILLPALSMAAGPWFVSTIGNDANDCLSAATACLTIQAAVTKASAGDVINVAAGTYAEHVSVNKSLTFNGANAGTIGSSTARLAESIVDGTDTGSPFAIMANDVTIDGFTVKNGSTGLNSGIWSQTGTMNSIIRNNIITANDFGIWAQCGGNCLIQANLFDANNKAGPGTDSISADATTGLTINNNEFKNDTVGNPILMQAVAPGAHTNLAITNNNFHGNTNASVMYLLAIVGGTITGNTILPAADVTGISLSGADVNVNINHNLITGAARGVRVEDAGYYSTSSPNSNILVNRNDVSGNTTYGIGNTDATIASLNGSCNWWGSASGPGPVGPGTGSPVTSAVGFSPWLTASALDGTCNGGQVSVHIFKFIDNAMATALTASSSAFPMLTTYSSTNIGSATDAPFTLSPTGWGAGDVAYEASFNNSNPGANYATHEVTGGSVVGATCASGTPFALVGYSTGGTLAAAAAAVATTTPPSFTNLQQDQYVIVRNMTCVATPPVPTTKNQCMNNGWMTLKDSLGHSFKNQGDCVSFVATKGKNLGAGN